MDSCGFGFLFLIWFTSAQMCCIQMSFKMKVSLIILVMQVAIFAKYDSVGQGRAWAYRTHGGRNLYFIRE